MLWKHVPFLLFGQCVKKTSRCSRKHPFLTVVLGLSPVSLLRFWQKALLVQCWCFGFPCRSYTGGLLPRAGYVHLLFSPAERLRGTKKDASLPAAFEVFVQATAIGREHCRFFQGRICWAAVKRWQMAGGIPRGWLQPGLPKLCAR